MGPVARAGGQCAAGQRWTGHAQDRGHRDRLRHLPDRVHGLSRQSQRAARAAAQRDPPDEPRADLRGADDRPDEVPGRCAHRGPAQDGGHLHERPPVRDLAAGRRRPDAQPLRLQSPDRGPGRRARLERLGRRPVQRSLQDPLGAHRRRRAEAETEVGLRLSGRTLGLRPADRRGRPGLRGQRHRLCLFARCADGLRLLVVPGQGHGAQRGEGGAGQGRGGRQARGVLRRLPRQRLWSGRPDRPRALDHAGLGPLRGADHRRPRGL